MYYRACVCVCVVTVSHLKNFGVDRVGVRAQRARSIPGPATNTRAPQRGGAILARVCCECPRQILELNFLSRQIPRY